MASLKDKIAATGSGARTAKLSEKGDKVIGVVESATIRQSRDGDGNPDFWDDGNPKEQVVVIVQTDLDEGEDDEGRPDDGRRAIYIKTWGNQWRALNKAVKEAETDDVYAGTTFGAKVIGLGEKLKKAWKPEKLFAFKVEAPKVSSGANFDDDDDDAETVEEPKPAPKRRTRATPKKDAAEALKDAGLDDDEF